MTAPFLREAWAHQLHVIAVISNTQRFRTRYDLYLDFAARMAQAGVQLWTVECAFGQRAWAITKADNPQHLQVRTDSELWHKENLVNLGVRALPPEARYLAWIDADVGFVRPDWAEETIHLLQRYPVVQLCSRISDLNPQYESFQTHKSFGWCVHHEQAYLGDGYVGKRGSWHPGFAWAMRRETYDALGGLYDRAILGSADRYMAHSFIGDVAPFIENKGFHPALVRSVLSWQDRAASVVRGQVGYMPGTLVHYWHGAKANRKYIERWDLLRKHQFDPYTDVTTDAAGLLQFTGTKPALEADVTRYFAERSEDDLHWEPAA